MSGYSVQKADRRLGYLLLTPVLVLLLATVAYPLLSTLWFSLFDAHNPTEFIGLREYLRAWLDPDLHLALTITLLFVLITVPGAMLLGLLLALAGHQQNRWRWLVRLALLLPWVLPMSYTGMIFAWFFHTEYGVVNELLRHAGLPAQAFLLSPYWSVAAVALAIIWKTSSFVALVLLPGLQAIPSNLYQAARLEGANRWQQFTHLTLPLLWPSLVVALIFRTLSAVQTFDIPYAMTQGGPGQATQTLAMLINTVSMEYLDQNYGSALAMLLFAVALAANLPYLSYLRRRLA